MAFLQVAASAFMGMALPRQVVAGVCKSESESGVFAAALVVAVDSERGASLGMLREKLLYRVHGLSAAFMSGPRFKNEPKPVKQKVKVQVWNDRQRCRKTENIVKLMDVVFKRLKVA
jgi:hypothetical protein